MKLEFAKTDFPDKYSQVLNGKGMIFSTNYVGFLMDISVSAVGDILCKLKSTEAPTAFQFKDEVGDLIVGAKITYSESTTNETAGSWDYVWSFDKKDFEGIDRVSDLQDQSLQMYFAYRAGNKYGMEYKDGKLYPMHNLLMSVLKSWLTENAKSGEDFEVQMDDVFLARSGIEGGETVLSFEPLGEMVHIAKGDGDKILEAKEATKIA